jgi:ketosteroid isomerase-like protein
LKTSLLPFLLGFVFLAGCRTGRAPVPSQPAPRPDLTELREAVWETELAFAATMADRDHDAFVSFLDEETVFFSGQQPLRGRAAVARAWLPFFQGSTAPFSWEPDVVEPLSSGELALSTGPVLAPDGSRIGRFNSIWRWNGTAWRIVFDRGED